ncbi:MAG: (5-formylfuran-3-yl)methyl phosphate synthase [Gemmatimonadales bacterium]
MRLLVSVRSGEEVEPALAGGAEIVDAKEPSLGSLGAVSPATLGEIARRVPAAVPLSVALGDPGSVAGVVEAIAAVDRAVDPRGELYVKLGLAGTSDPDAARSLMAAAVAAAARVVSRPVVIAVAYADQEAAGAPDRHTVSRIAARVGVGGVLLDTFVKDGRDLFAHVGDGDLGAWVERARQAGLLVALAGSLSAGGLRRAAGFSADILGVRGAACAGGREGVLVEARVRTLRAMLRGAPVVVRSL